jgi:intracellular sulfur oxidation DsrE/DsrF family protein
MITTHYSEVFMNRLLIAFLIVVSAAAVAFSQPPDKPSSKDQTMFRTVFHVNFGDQERQKHGLNNIENILKEVDDAQIEVVCHGEGISLVETKSKHADLVQSLLKKRVRFVACENTMKKKSLSKEDLVVGTGTVPSGAVEVIRKQGEGYAYFRP